MARHALLVFVLLAGCARSEDASVVASSNEVTAVEQVRTPEDDDEELALGEWRDTLQEENAALEFGPTGAPPLFSLRCDARRSVFLQRHGAAPARDLPVMLITIGSETRRLAVTNIGGAVPMLRASLASSDTLIRSLVGSTTPIIVRVGDTPPLVLPPSPNIAVFSNAAERLRRRGRPGTGGKASTEAMPPRGAGAARPPLNRPHRVNGVSSCRRRQPRRYDSGVRGATVAPAPTPPPPRPRTRRRGAGALGRAEAPLAAGD